MMAKTRALLAALLAPGRSPPAQRVCALLAYTTPRMPKRRVKQLQVSAPTTIAMIARVLLVSKGSEPGRTGGFASDTATPNVGDETTRP
jgi:hypothetical protein